MGFLILNVAFFYYYIYSKHVITMGKGLI